MNTRLVAFAFVMLVLAWLSPNVTAQTAGRDRRANTRVSEIKVLVLNFTPAIRTA